jgi:group I intron endonuclease
MNTNILLNESDRYVEIYIITNLSNNKCYVGQTVSHVLNHGKYRKYGYIKRFNAHISEAKSTKKNQCIYLNNAINAYGIQNFKVELIEVCDVNDADKREYENILKYNTMAPNGYNLKLGGTVFRHTDESKKKLSDSVLKYSRELKYNKYMNIKLNITGDIEKYIHPLNRFDKQYGWYILVSGKKTDFGGIHITLDDSKKMAIDFINKLKELCDNNETAKHLVAGNPLEPIIPSSSGNE